MEQSTLDSALSLHDAIITSIHNMLEESTPQLNTNTDQIIIALHARQLCGADSVSILSKRNFFTFVPVILRSMLEARIDLINLVSDSDYIRTMTYNFSLQEIKFLRHAKKDKANLENFEGDSIATSRLEKAKSYCIDNNDVSSKVNAYERFQKANLIDEYYVTYNELCRSTHNNLDKLKSDHFPYGDFEFFTHTLANFTNLIVYWFISSNICLHSAQLVGHHFEITSNHIHIALENYQKLEDLLRSN